MLGPLSRISRLRSLIVGRASRTSGRSCENSLARFLVAGFDAATSGSRSSRVARRFTNVVLALRSEAGSRRSDWSRATFSSPIAAAVWSALPTSCERSSRRAAIAVTVRAVSVTKRWKVTLSAMISRTRREEVDSVGLKYLRARFACWALFMYWVAPPFTIFWRAASVAGSSVSKSWSRSTGAVTSSGGIWPPSGIFSALFGRQWLI